MRRFVVAVALAGLLAACSGGGGATQAPGGGGGASTAPSANPGGGVPTEAPSDASGSGPGASGGGAGFGGVDPAGLTTVPAAKMCTLLTKDEAASILGAAISAEPSGMTLEGLGTNCIWIASGDKSPQIKVEFNTMGWKTQTDLLKVGGKSRDLTVSGRPAVGVDAPTDGSSMLGSQVVVSLSDDPAATCLYVEAPTVDQGVSVAQLVLPRIAGLK